MPDAAIPGGVGIVTALAAEARALTRQPLRVKTALPLASAGMLWLSGMGQEAARQGALGLIQAGAAALVSFGVAGGLAPSLRSGTLVCPTAVLDERGRDYLTDAAWRMSLIDRLADAKMLPVEQGSLLSLPAPLLGVNDKAAMRERHQAVAVDMESAAIAAVANEFHLPFLVLRAIVDTREDHVPVELNTSVDAFGRPRVEHLLGGLLRHPGLLVQLPGLAIRMHKATRALRMAVTVVGVELGHEARQPC